MVSKKPDVKGNGVEPIRKKSETTHTAQAGKQCAGSHAVSFETRPKEMEKIQIRLRTLNVHAYAWPLVCVEALPVFAINFLAYC